MNFISLRTGLPLLLLVAAAGTLTPGCVGVDCGDCGPCSMNGGLNETDGMIVAQPGVSPAGIAAVDVVLSRAGECGLQNAQRQRISWDAGISIAPVANVDDLSTEATSIGSSGAGKTTYLYADRPLAVIQERESATSVKLTFNENGGGSAIVRCIQDANVNATVTCSEVTE